MDAPTQLLNYLASRWVMSGTLGGKRRTHDVEAEWVLKREYIRFHEVSLDQLDNIVLINRDAALAGTVPVARLILAASDQRMAELAFEPLLSVRPDAKDKEVFELFDKYNLRSLVVVDEANCPTGTITVDDVVSRLRAKI